MMNVFPCSLLLIFGILASPVSGQCSICPNGVEIATATLPMPDADGNILTCANVDSVYQGYDRFECLAIQPVVMPLCCPSQLSIYAVDNVCGWCPNGVSDVYREVPDPILQQNATCLNSMELVSFQEDSDSCGFFDQAASYCCPGDAPPRFICEFCPKGVENPDLDPDGEGSSCTQIQALTSKLSDYQTCNFFKSIELSCCPKTTELKLCDFCPKGIVITDTSLPLPGGPTCTDIQKNATLVPEGDLCDLLKSAEDPCCPDSASVTLQPVLPLPPPVSPPTDLTGVEGDYCYICGSADVEMTNPSYKPFALFNDDSQSSQTCVELEQEYNQNRFPGASCKITLTTLTALLYTPSACGCVGFEPPRACEVCVGRDLNRDLIAPNFGVTCGEGFDVLQHAQAAVCGMQDLNLEALEEACCSDSSPSPDTNDGGGNGGAQDVVSASASSSILMGLLLCVLTVFVSV